MNASEHPPQAGFTLAVLIFFLTAATILIAVTVPTYQMQAKRAQEEELIFRGEEYVRAIRAFQRKFSAWPPSIDALIETNGLRFLRKAYKDPISGKPFRLITINPDGTLNGSLLFKASNPFAPQGSNNPFAPQGTNQGQPNPQNAPGQRPQNPAQFGQQPGQAFPNQRPQQPQNFQQSQQLQPGGQQQPNAPGLPNQADGSAPTPVGSGIIGVASESDKDSIKVYNTRQKYNEWEFTAVLNQANPNQQVPNPQNPNGARGAGGVNAPGFGPNGALPGFNQPNMPQPGSNQPGFNQPNMPQPGFNQPRSPFGFGSPQQPPQPPARNPG